MSRRKSKPTVSPVEFIDKIIRLDEKGEAFKLPRISAVCWKWR
jgi:hypothetical protein